MLSLKRLVPPTLFGRALLIIVTPLVLLQVVAALVFFERHWDTVGRHLALSLAGDIASVINILEAFPDKDDQAFVLWTAHMYMALETRIDLGAELPAAKPFSGYDPLRPTLITALEAQLGRPFVIDTETLPRHVIISVPIDDGVLHVTASRKRVFSTTTYIFIMWMVGSAIVLFAVAIYFLRKQLRPIRRLAKAADSFGKGHEVANFKLEGAREVRQAASAFIRMRDRIKIQIAQRTELLAGVSHDLRTPLTRMKLQLAMLGGGDDIEDLKSDVAEMEKMIDDYLDFARGEGGEAAQSTDLTALLDEVAASARRHGGDIAFEPGGPIEITLRRNAMKRCFTNLVDNALRHGRHCAMAVVRDGEAIEVTVDDDGPGIPEAEREEVFRAFYRLDASRNLETGGVGLGLTIARDVARGHGGDITLATAPAGGLRALVRLPL